MPKPFAEHSGSSAHLQLSLWQDGAPAFTPVDGAENELTLHAIAGLLEHLPSITLFGAHSVNAYRRFEPDSFAPATVTWSRDNRSAAVRSLVEASPEANRIELRTGGGRREPLLAGGLRAGCRDRWAAGRAKAVGGAWREPVRDRDAATRVARRRPRARLAGRHHRRKLRSAIRFRLRGNCAQRMGRLHGQVSDWGRQRYLTSS